MKNIFTTTFNGIPKPPDRRSRFHPLIDFHSSSAKKSPHNITHRTTKYYSISIIPIRIHRDRNDCGSLLTCKSKAPQRQPLTQGDLVREALPMLPGGKSG